MFSFTENGLRFPLIHIGYHKALFSWMQKHLFLSECGFVTIMGPLAVRVEIIDPTPFALEAKKVVECLKRDSKNMSKKKEEEDLLRATKGYPS
jgi:hypothetical protein